MIPKLKIIELASVLAGPSVGQFFAELGAEVIKVENINTGGDVTRSWKSAGEQTDDRSAYFCSVNWGKKSIALDLLKTEDQVIVHKLVKNADIVIASYKPGDDKKLGVDYDTLSQINPTLIYGKITGYGSDNPRVGYDAVLQAEAGFMYMNGEEGGPSLKMPVALIDVLAGHQLKEALLLAMLEKTITNKGKLVEVSLIQTAVSSLANQATNWLVAGKMPKKHGSAHPNIAPYGDVFFTKDKTEILLAVGSDRQFEDLCKVLNRESLAKDSLFNTNQKRVENREQLNIQLQKEFNLFLCDELLNKINHAKIPAGVIQNLKQVFEMHEAKDLLISSDNLRGVRTFVGTTDRTSLLPPPHLGEHSKEILDNIIINN
ncbi:MAG TPA: CaiB/BaiF CoA-transferase family protein [Cyclobacteriaceae bacterium]